MKSDLFFISSAEMKSVVFSFFMNPGTGLRIPPFNGSRTELNLVTDSPL